MTGEQGQDAGALRGKRVAVVGAGPGGATLARLLQMRGADVTVFERDSSRDSRNQGATLDLHHDAGLLALKAAGLMDAFRANYRPGADSLLIADAQAHILYTDTSRSGHALERPEIDRGPLRNLLIDSLLPRTLRWDHKLESAVPTGKGVELRFSNGERFTADLAVGADGVNSRLRALVTPIRPLYSGVTVVEGNIARAAESIPEIVRMLAGTHRAVLALGGEKSLAAGSKGDGSAAFYGGLKVAEGGTGSEGLDLSTAAGRKAWFYRTYAGWSTIWEPLFEYSEALKFRPQYVCPFDQSWAAQPYATLIGDAAHVMPPYAGEGVNMAMLDALVLADQLTGPRDVQLAIEAYQREMFLRTSTVAQETMRNTEAFHAPDAAELIVAMFKGHDMEYANG